MQAEIVGHRIKLQHLKAEPSHASHGAPRNAWRHHRKRGAQRAAPSDNSARGQNG